MKNFQVIVVFILFFTACNSTRKDKLGQSLPPAECIEHLFFSNSNADFGDVRIGMMRAAFEEAHGEGGGNLQSDEIIDSVDLCYDKSGAYAENAYRFFDNRLADIQSTLFLESAAVVNELILVEVSALSKKFGPSLFEKGIYTWKVEREASILYVYLSDQSARYGRPVLQLQYITEGKVSV